MKRVEANKLSKDLQLQNVEKRGAEESLNSRITKHLDKIQTITEQVRILQTKVITLEKEKTQCDKDKTQCKNENGEFQHSVDSLTKQMDTCKKGKEESDGQVTGLQSQIETLQNQIGSLRTLIDNMRKLPQHPNVPQSPPGFSQPQRWNSIPQQQQPGVPANGIGSQSHPGLPQHPNAPQSHPGKNPDELQDSDHNKQEEEPGAKGHLIDVSEAEEEVLEPVEVPKEASEDALLNELKAKKEEAEENEDAA